MARIRHGIIALIAALALAACSGQELYRDVNEREANEMISVLMRAGIEATKTPGEKGTFTVEVAQGQFAEAVDVLRQNGLPRDSFESLGTVFKKEGFTSSSLAERARLVYGLSEELSDTISRFDGVIEARVHLSMPEADALSGVANPSSASVFVKYREGMDLPAQTAAIKSLVTNSIEGLEYDRVSVAMTAAKPVVVPARSTMSDTVRAVFVPLAVALGLLLLIAAGWRLFAMRSGKGRAVAAPLRASAKATDD
jgi:type III secretion protein J